MPSGLTPGSRLGGTTAEVLGRRLGRRSLFRGFALTGLGLTGAVLVGCDGSPNSMEALRWAIDFASPGGTVVVAWVWDATPLAVGADAFFFPDASDLAADRFHHLVDSVADQARLRDVTLEREFVRGTPRSALASQAENADIVVVGARGHGAVGAALLGSVSTWLLHHLHRPIAVVPFTV